MDQGIHLLETRQMVVDKKLRLLGPTTSKKYQQRNAFFGANYYYILAILGIINQWNPLAITVSLILLNFFCILFFVHWLNKKIGLLFSSAVFIFLATCSHLITHSRFIWNPHLLIPSAIFFIYFLDEYKKNIRSTYLFASAFFWGMAFSFHYTAIIWFALFIPLLIQKGKISLVRKIFPIFTGFIIGNLLFFIFEIRNSFYNSKTMFLALTQTNNSSLNLHYFTFPLLIITIYLLGLLIRKKSVYQKPIIFSFLVINIVQLFGPTTASPLDNYPQWNYQLQKQIVQKIVDQNPTNFNIATTFRGDTRAYDLRFLLTINNHLPLPADQHPWADTIFLIAPSNRPIEQETVWEIDSFKPFIISQKETLTSNLTFYQLDKLR